MSPSQNPKLALGGAFLLGAATILASVSPLVAEIPLPDAVVYGLAPSAGDFRATVSRRAGAALEVPGVLVTYEGTRYFVIRVPMETSIGAPGPSGAAAKEGDILESVALDGAPLVAVGEPLSTGRVIPVSTGGDVVYFFRGDCNADLGFDIADALFLLFSLYVDGRRPACLRACDAGRDGAVNIADVIFMLHSLFLGSASPPAPSGHCGADLQPSALSCELSPCRAGGGGGVEDGNEVVVAGALALRAPPSPRVLERDAAELAAQGFRLGVLEAAIGRPALRARGAAQFLVQGRLAVSPGKLWLGEVGGASPQATLLVENRGPFEARVAVETNRETLLVEPDGLQIPAGDSIVVTVRPRAGARAEDLEDALVTVNENGTGDRLAVPVEAAATAGFTVISALDVEVAVGTAGEIFVPVLVDARTDLASATFRVSAEVLQFARLAFVPAAGRAIRAHIDEHDGAVAVQATLNGAGARRLDLGRIVLEPHAPLLRGVIPIALEPVSAHGVDGQPLPLAVTHGELVARCPPVGLAIARAAFGHIFRGEPAPECFERLDADGDGRVGIDEVLAVARAALGAR